MDNLTNDRFEKEYELIFEMPATVRVSVKVRACNQQDAIVQGFDKVLDEAEIMAKSRCAEVVCFDSQAAQLQDMNSFEIACMPSTVAMPSDLSSIKEYKVGLFQLSKGQFTVLCEQYFQTKDAALSYAKDVAQDRVDVSYCRVFDPDQKCILTAHSERKGVEIRYVLDGQKQVKSGFESAVEAITYILNFKKKNSIKEDTLFEIFEINDLDRSTYPKLITTVN